MKIYVYWNTNNNDCKKIFHFMSPDDKYSITGKLKENNNLLIKRVWQPFDNATEILNGIQEHELVIFLTHGTEDQILKYRNSPERDIKEYVLIDKENANILNNKIVLAFCCLSAKDLGEFCVTPEIGCRAFVGFNKEIVYDNGKAAKSRHIIYQSYKIAFMKSLKYAIKHRCTIEEYRIKLMQYMRNEAAKAILEAEDRSLNNIYSGTIQGLVSLGDTAQKLFN